VQGLAIDLPPAATEAPTAQLDRQAFIDFQADLRRRQEGSTSAASSLTAANGSSVMPGTAMTVSAPGGLATGMFTAADGGVYDVTSQSGYVVIDSKTLQLGQGALIGNEEVSLGSSGLVAAGQAVALSTVSTSSAAAAATTSSASPSSSPSVSTFVSTSTRSESAVSTISTQITMTSSVTTSSSAAAAARQTAGSMMAAAGGLLGLMIL
jgi:hypothetical protein